MYCLEHNEYHKGKVRKFGCLIHKELNIKSEFQPWFNENIDAIKSHLAIAEYRAGKVKQ